MYNSELDTFLAVAEAGSFSKAAKKLYISTPAVVQQMNLLEKRLNVQLFVRNTHGVTLTPAGIKFIQWSRQIIFDCQQAEKELGKYQQKIVFASGYLNGQTLSSRLIPQFQKNHPKAQISFREINNYQQIPAEVDILEMAYAKEPLSEHEFSFISIVPSPLRVALPASHPLAKKKQLSLQDLAAQDLEIVALSIAGSEDAMLRKLLNVRPAVKLHYYSVFNKAAVNQAQLTKHLVLIPEAYSELCHPYIVKPVSWSFATSYGFYCRKPVPKLVQEFIDLAQKS